MARKLGRKRGSREERDHEGGMEGRIKEGRKNRKYGLLDFVKHRKFE